MNLNINFRRFFRNSSKKFAITYVKGHPHDPFKMYKITNRGLPHHSICRFSGIYYTKNPHEMICKLCKKQLILGMTIYLYSNSGYFSSDTFKFYCLDCCPNVMDFVKAVYGNEYTINDLALEL